MTALHTRLWGGGGLGAGGGLGGGGRLGGSGLRCGGRLGRGRLGGGGLWSGGLGGGSWADAVGKHRLFRDWVECWLHRACGIEVVPLPTPIFAVGTAVERPDVEVPIVGDHAIETNVHIRLDLRLRPRVVPEPGR